MLALTAPGWEPEWGSDWGNELEKESVRETVGSMTAETRGIGHRMLQSVKSMAGGVGCISRSLSMAEVIRQISKGFFYPFSIERLVCTLELNF